jgi:hypothetical protein
LGIRNTPVLKKVGRNFFNKTRRQPNFTCFKALLNYFEKDPAERDIYKTILRLNYAE